MRDELDLVAKDVTVALLIKFAEKSGPQTLLLE